MVNHQNAGSKPQKDSMVSNTDGIGYFTAENIVAVLRVLPESDGTYAEVVKHARNYDGGVPRDLLGNGVATGR